MIPIVGRLLAERKVISLVTAPWGARSAQNCLFLPRSALSVHWAACWEHFGWHIFQIIWGIESLVASHTHKKILENNPGCCCFLSQPFLICVSPLCSPQQLKGLCSQRPKPAFADEPHFRIQNLISESKSGWERAAGSFGAFPQLYSWHWASLLCFLKVSGRIHLPSLRIISIFICIYGQENFVWRCHPSVLINPSPLIFGFWLCFPLLFLAAFKQLQLSAQFFTVQTRLRGFPAFHSVCFISSGILIILGCSSMGFLK